MSSTAVIVLSSSPPQSFARSPTPAEIPSPSGSPGTPLKDGSKRFKNFTRARDRFSGSFGSARALLVKTGVENLPLQSLGRAKFKSPLSKRPVHSATSSVPALKFKRRINLPAEQKPDRDRPDGPSSQLSTPGLEAAKEALSLDLEDNRKELVLPLSQKETHNSRCSSPHQFEKAVPRRLDWTPVKAIETSLDTPESGEPYVGFCNSLLSSYAFDDTSFSGIPKTVTTHNASEGEQTNTKRRIDLVMPTEATGGFLIAKSKTAKEETKGLSKAKPKTKVKAKAPKKPVTITALATSAYGDEQQKQGELPLMLESLTASQAAAESHYDAMIDVSLNNLSRTMVAGKKVRTITKISAKSRLVSPTSAIQATDEQPFLFGSASQLARDESPTLLRDTLEALKRSEVLSSDPISPQRSQSFSVESTSPWFMQGTSRFVRTRKLWTAADRDEDNALLQIETIDLMDTPAVRQALAGKDALMQSHGLDHSMPHLPSAQTPCAKSAGVTIDIDDFPTPAVLRPATSLANSSVRMMHTGRTLNEPALPKESGPQQLEASMDPKKAPSGRPPIMPCYGGFPEYELKKLVAGFGFKPIKKREKMIELLEQCWKSTHGIEPVSDGENATTNLPTHNEVLSKVHDVSARPVPKVKKPGAKRKSDPTDRATPKEPKKPRAKRKSDTTHPATPEEPKKRKKTANKTDEHPTEKKVPRKRAAEKEVLSDEKVVDVDDIDTPKVHQVTGKHGDLPKAPHPLERTAKAKSDPVRPATPPPTIPQPDLPLSSPGLEDLQQPGPQATSTLIPRHVGIFVLTPQATPSLDILVQIHAAIHHRAEVQGTDARNHQVSPTWREKILMYDPIVLEELTVWLNTEGFKAIGEDREVSPLQVRDWCEQHGVCCLGVGGGWRGRGRPTESE